MTTIGYRMGAVSWTVGLCVEYTRMPGLGRYGRLEESGSDRDADCGEYATGEEPRVVLDPPADPVTELQADQ